MGTTAADVVADLAPTGVLRAAINLGNPVLANGGPADPGGVTVDLARAVAARLGVPVDLLCFAAARESYEAMVTGRADICFLAIEPARAAEVAFTTPYLLIEGVYAVPAQSPITTTADVDRPGVRVAVKRGSAYDLFLSRTLQHATLVRTEEAAYDQANVAAGIRQPVTAFVAAHPEYRLLDDRFMQIRQAVGTTKTRRPETVQFLRELIEELKAGGFVAAALRRANQSEALVAPPA
jgi:polar amino acid transport system substrate-binding protein